MINSMKLILRIKNNIIKEIRSNYMKMIIKESKVQFKTLEYKGKEIKLDS